MIREKQSFTLVEILVVIVIIGILSSFIFFTINDSVEKASIAKSKMFSESIRNNLLLNLVSEWKFDDSTNLGLDSWGSNNGTNNGATAITDESECISGGCASFDGTDDYIEVSNNSTLQPQEAITISFWMKSNIKDSTYRRIIRKDYSYFVQQMSNDRISFYLYLNSTQYAIDILSTDWNIGNWYFIVATYDKNIENNNMKLYLDSNLKSSTYHTYSITTSSSNLAMGTLLNSGGYFNGSLDEVQIYNAAIQESEIKQNYLSGLNNLYGKGLITEAEYNIKISVLAENH
jgi:prepilin-type N-terminal cleavage/methylation domain-containing protein